VQDAALTPETPPEACGTSEPAFKALFTLPPAFILQHVRNHPPHSPFFLRESTRHDTTRHDTTRHDQRHDAQHMRRVLHGGQVRNRNEALLLLQISCAGRKMDQLVRLFITELQQGDARALLDLLGL
jgi:hypothetical protein